MSTEYSKPQIPSIHSIDEHSQTPNDIGHNSFSVDTNTISTTTTITTTTASTTPNITSTATINPNEFRLPVVNAFDSSEASSAATIDGNQSSSTSSKQVDTIVDALNALNASRNTPNAINDVPINITENFSIFNNNETRTDNIDQNSTNIDNILHNSVANRTQTNIITSRTSKSYAAAIDVVGIDNNQAAFNIQRTLEKNQFNTINSLMLPENVTTATNPIVAETTTTAPTNFIVLPNHGLKSKNIASTRSDGLLPMYPVYRKSTEAHPHVDREFDNTTAIMNNKSSSTMPAIHKLNQTSQFGRSTSNIIEKNVVTAKSIFQTPMDPISTPINISSIRPKTVESVTLATIVENSTLKTTAKQYEVKTVTNKMTTFNPPSVQMSAETTTNFRTLPATAAMTTDPTTLITTTISAMTTKIDHNITTVPSTEMTNITATTLTVTIAHEFGSSVNTRNLSIVPKSIYSDNNNNPPRFVHNSTALYIANSLNDSLAAPSEYSVFNSIELNKQLINSHDQQQNQQTQNMPKTIRKPISLDEYQLLLMEMRTLNAKSKSIDDKSKQNLTMLMLQDPIVQRMIESLNDTAFPLISDHRKYSLSEQIPPKSITEQPSRLLAALSNASISRAPRRYDYLIYGILPNTTVIRKDPNVIYAMDDVQATKLNDSSFVYGILSNGTLIRKYPNGTKTIVTLKPSSQYEITDIDAAQLLDPTSIIYRRQMSSSHQPNARMSVAFGNDSNGLSVVAARPTFNSQNNLANGIFAFGSTVFQLPPFNFLSRIQQQQYVAKRIAYHLYATLAIQFKKSYLYIFGVYRSRSLSLSFSIY